jgi:UDP-glucuronate 4-epimerase
LEDRGDILQTILITGGAGFIGSNLAQELLRKGNKVIIIDNYNDYYDPRIKRSNVEEVLQFMKDNGIEDKNLLLYEGDIRDKNFLEKVFMNPMEVVVHLAAMAGVRYSIENPELYYNVNINGTFHLLEECRKNRISKFIFASSSSVYGNNKKVPFREGDPVDHPISPYAATKKSGELLCYTYHHLYDISIACLRFFTVYGPRQRPDLAIRKFTKLMLQDQEIPFYGDGTNERDYTYIEDIIDGINRAISWMDTGKKQFDIFNLGGEHSISLKEMVATIEEVLGKKAKLKMLPMQAGDVDRTCADLTKVNKSLGFQPKTEFKEGIGKFVEWVCRMGQ